MTIQTTNNPVTDNGSDEKSYYINTKGKGFINSAKLVRQLDKDGSVINHLILKLSLQQGKVEQKNYDKVQTWNFECFVSDAVTDKGQSTEHKLKDILMEHLFPEDAVQAEVNGAKEFSVFDKLEDRKITCAVTTSGIRDIDFTCYKGKVSYLIKSNIISAGYVYENGKPIYERAKQEEQQADQQQAA